MAETIHRTPTPAWRVDMIQLSIGRIIDYLKGNLRTAFNSVMYPVDMYTIATHLQEHLRAAFHCVLHPLKIIAHQALTLGNTHAHIQGRVQELEAERLDL